MALEHGADLVVEMPFWYRFSRLTILLRENQHFTQARCGKLVFGTEEMLDYQKIADIYVDNSEEMENFVKT